MSSIYSLCFRINAHFCWIWLSLGERKKNLLKVVLGILIWYQMKLDEQKKMCQANRANCD